jgi:hypothetical protein
MCIRYGNEDVVKTFGLRLLTAKKTRRSRISPSRPQGWHTGTYAEIARNKVDDMDKNSI